MAHKIISFFQQFHNGDLFVSKEYVRDVIESLPDFKFKYYHNNHPKALGDINAEYAGSPDGVFDKRTPFLDFNQEFCINTWLGVYHKKDINFDQLHTAWEKIYTAINEKFNVNLTLKDNFVPVGTLSIMPINISQLLLLFSK